MTTTPDRVSADAEERATASAPHTKVPDSATPRATPQGGGLKLILILGSLIALGPLTIDMYLPALPTITTELLTTSASVQLTLTGTLLGLAGGQLIVGPLSDALGRKRPLIAGTLLHVIASILCVFAPNIAVLGGLRVLQGLGAAAGAVIAMAIVRDLFRGRAAATLLSRLILVMGAAPVIAPTLGGELLRFTSWRGVFAALAVFGLILIPVAMWGLRETLPPERRRTAGVRGTLRDYGTILRDTKFVGLALVTGLAMSAVMSYVSGSSFVYQEQYGLDQQQFGLVFGSGAVWLIAATQLNPVLLRWFEPRAIMLTAVSAASGAGLLLVLIAATGFGGLWGLVPGLWLVLFSVGFAMPNAPAVALSRHGATAGTAAALLGAAQFGIGAVISPLVGVLGNTAIAMAVTVAGGLLLGLLVMLVVVRPWTLADSDEEPAPAV